MSLSCCLDIQLPLFAEGEQGTGRKKSPSSDTWELLQTQRALSCPALSRLLAQVSVHRNPWVKSGPLLGLVNKVLLKQAQTHHVHSIYNIYVSLSYASVRKRAATETVRLTKSDMFLSHSSRKTRQISL